MPKAKGTHMANLLERVSIDPAVCGGRPCIRGTRIWVSLILDLLASGMAEAQVRTEYPQLTHEDILAAIAYGAEASRERVIPLPVEPAE
jgi:uncharacterized protein (DUF433 family)